MASGEDKGLEACSPRRKLNEARRIDQAASKSLDASAEAKDECDFKADSKEDSKPFDCKHERDQTIDAFSRNFIRSIITSTPKR